MTASSLRAKPRRRFAWLLWFGLLFAVAQDASSAHAISHIAGPDSGRTGDAGLVHGQCQLCLIGASIGGAAPLPAEPSAPQLMRAAVPQESTVSAPPSARAAIPYRSRAPPVASR